MVRLMHLYIICNVPVNLTFFEIQQINIKKCWHILHFKHKKFPNPLQKQDTVAIGNHQYKNQPDVYFIRRTGLHAMETRVCLFIFKMWLSGKDTNNLNPYASMFAYLAWLWINSLRGNTSSPINMENILSVSAALSMVTWRNFRFSGFIVVCHNCSEVISPRPL